MSTSALSPSSCAAYWRQKLARVSTPVTLAPAIGSLRSGVTHYNQLRVDLPDDLIRRVWTAGSGSSFLVFVTLLSALKICLFRHTGSTCVAIATPPWRRDDNTTEPDVWLPAVDWLERSQTFRETLQGVRGTLTQCYTHSDIALRELLAQSEAAHLGQLCRVACIVSDHGTPLSSDGFDLVVDFAVEAARPCARIVYDASRYDKRAVDQLIRHVITISRAGLDSPDTAISELPMLEDAERMLVEREWSSGPVTVSRLACVHHLFQDQVCLAPDAIAIVERDHHVSYHMLDTRARAIAATLVGRGVGPETVVALFVPRGIQFIAGMLGILKAGGAYLAADLAFPLERLAFLIEDANAVAVLVDSDHVDTLPSVNAQVVCLDEIVTLPNEPALTTTPVRPQNLAYVMYTSGSSGRPKGVSVEHRHLVQYVEAINARLNLQPTWNYALASTVAADLGHTTLFGSLCSGGTLHLIPEEFQLDAEAFIQYCRCTQIDCLKIVPSHLQVLVPEIQRRGRFVARLLVLGGESTSLPLLRSLEAISAAGSIAVHYGPTECTVGSTAHVIASDEPQTDPLPIGRPLDGVQTYVLDESGEAAAIGVPGELFIGGAGVTRGYLHRAALTAAHFVPDRFSGRAGARLYRTGDRVQWRSDGALQYLGRFDHQVKVRGYRVELGEIETALLGHPGVYQAAVVADNSTRDLRLVAYVAGAEDVSANTLRSYLGTRLPEYMLPSVFISLPALRLTRNGKVDRTALPAPDSHLGAPVSEWVPPRTPVEEIVAGIWADVLRRPRVSAAENFFELGGHSLLATQVVARLQGAFGIEVPLRALFDAPTAAGVAAAIESALTATAPHTAPPPLVRMPRNGELPLSFAQQRLWFLDQLDPGSPTYNVPIAVRFRGSLNLSAVRQSLTSIVIRHEVLRTTFHLSNGEPVQRVRSEPQLDWRVCELTRLPPFHREDAVHVAVGLEAARPFDLSRSSLRVRVLRLESDDHVLLVTMHHIVSDAWSMGVLVREFTAFYAALQARQNLVIPPLAVQYGDFAVWQRNWLTGSVLEAQVAYWQSQLEGLSTLELPTDRPRPSERRPTGTRVNITIDVATTTELRRVGRQEGVTLFMVLLAAFQLQLGRYARQSDVAVGTVIANRGRLETEALIGFFVNTLVLRTVMRGVRTVRDLLARVRDVTLGAYAHQDVPFEQLVQLLQPERDLGRSPMFQALLEFNNSPAPISDVPGAELTALIAPGPVLTKFDLTLNLMEGPAGIVGQLTCASDLFTLSAARRLAIHFQWLVEQIAVDVLCDVAGLAVLTPAEQAEITRWNATERPYPRESTLAEMFEAQANRAPEAVAVIAGEDHVTYGELDRRTNQLAHLLRAEGVRLEDRVGVCLERSIRSVETVLAVVKSGAAYAPLDPGDPSSRQNLLISDTKPRVIVTAGEDGVALAAKGARTLNLDLEVTRLAAQPIERPIDSVTPLNLAYVLYTSGSTGQPKGIGVPHRAIVRLLCGTDYVRCDASRRVLHHSPLTFDASTFELWAPLLHGGCCVIASEVDLDPRQLRLVLRREAITTLWLTAAVFNLVVDTASDALVSVEELLVGGEALSASHVRRALEVLPRTQVINGYGPTEGTTFSCCARLNRYFVSECVVCADRLTHRKYSGLRRGRSGPIGCRRDSGRVVHRRGWSCESVRRPTETDGRTICA